MEAGGRLLANEMACRVHNSGHRTEEEAVTSQFENHLRAILGLRLGGTATLGPTAMPNPIAAPPPRAVLAALPGARVHVYGKTPAPGRKLGHVTLRVRSAPAPGRATLAQIQPAVKAVPERDFTPRTSKNADFVRAATHANVRLTVEEIRRESPVLRDLEAEGKLLVVGAIYDVGTGEVKLVD